MSDVPLLGRSVSDAFGGQRQSMRNDLVAIRAAFHTLRLRAHRVLALTCLFDFLFCFILWTIVCNGFHGKVQGSCIANSIMYFTFDKSLFDVICVAALRMLVLVVAYWFGRSTHSIFIIFTTMGTTLFLFAKIFFYNFSEDGRSTDYLVFLTSFILPWVEAFLWLGRIAPLNKKLNVLYGADNRGVVDPFKVDTIIMEERQLLAARYEPDGHMAPLSRRSVRESTRNEDSGPGYETFSHPAEPASPDGREQVHLQLPDTHDSDDDDTYDADSRYSTPPPSQPSDNRPLLRADNEYLDVGNEDVFSSKGSQDRHRRSNPDDMLSQRSGSLAKSNTYHMKSVVSPQNARCYQLGVEAHRRAMALADSNAWAEQLRRHGVVVSSMSSRGPDAGTRTTYQANGLVYASMGSLFSMLHKSFDSFPAWATTVTQARVVRRIATEADVVYFCLSEAFAKTMKPRDFVCVRFVVKTDKSYIISMASITHEMDSRTGYVRGIQHCFCFLLDPVPDQPDVTSLSIIMEADLKLRSFKKRCHEAIMNNVVELYESLRRKLDASHGGQNDFI